MKWEVNMRREKAKCKNFGQHVVAPARSSGGTISHLSYWSVLLQRASDLLLVCHWIEEVKADNMLAYKETLKRSA